MDTEDGEITDILWTMTVPEEEYFKIEGKLEAKATKGPYWMEIDIYPGMTIAADFKAEITDISIIPSSQQIRITASVTDSGGLSASDTVTVNLAASLKEVSFDWDWDVSNGGGGTGTSYDHQFEIEEVRADDPAVGFSITIEVTVSAPFCMDATAEKTLIVMGLSPPI